MIMVRFPAVAGKALREGRIHASEQIIMHNQLRPLFGMSERHAVYMAAVAMAEVDSPQESCLKPKRAGWNTSGCVGLEPYGAEVVPWRQAHVRVESGSQPPEQGDGGLGAALFDLPVRARSHTGAVSGRSRLVRVSAGPDTIFAAVELNPGRWFR
jgi:hypothetical protein